MGTLVDPCGGLLEPSHAQGVWESRSLALGNNQGYAGSKEIGAGLGVVSIRFGGRAVGLCGSEPPGGMARGPEVRGDSQRTRGEKF